MDLSHLSEPEREAILQVLQRDDDLRKKDEQRMHHLKSELYFLRKRGALKGDTDAETSCSRCRVELGLVVNRGAVCVSCQAKVCKSCRAYSSSGDQWVCVVCHKQMEIQAASGDWMNEFIRRPSRRRDNKVFVPPSDVVKHSIRRSWTSANVFRQNIDTSGAVKEVFSSSQFSSTSRQSQQHSVSHRPPHRSTALNNRPSTHDRPPSLHRNLPSAQRHQQYPVGGGGFNARMMDQMSSQPSSGLSSPSRTSPSVGRAGRSPTSAVIHVPQTPITAPARNTPSAMLESPKVSVKRRPSPSPQHAESETEPVSATQRTPTPKDPPGWQTSKARQGQLPSPAPRATKPSSSPVPRQDLLPESPKIDQRQRSPNQKQKTPVGNAAGGLVTSTPVPTKAPVQSQLSDIERHHSSESQDSGYVAPSLTPITHSGVSPRLMHKLSGEAFDSGYDNHGSPRTSRSSELSRQSSGVSSGRTDPQERAAESRSASDGSDGDGSENAVVFRKVMLRKKRESSKPQNITGVGGGTTNSSSPTHHCNFVPQPQPQPLPPWVQIGGAHSLPRAKSRTLHSLNSMSFYNQYSSSSPLSSSNACGEFESSGDSSGIFSHSNRPFSVMGGSLTLPRNGKLDGGHCDLSSYYSREESSAFDGLTTTSSTLTATTTTNTYREGPVVLRSVDCGGSIGHRRNPSGSPVVKRIRRSRRESSERGGRLRSPNRLEYGFTGGTLKNPLFEAKAASFEDIHSACLEFEEDLVVPRTFDSNDLLLSVTADKMIPEGDDYKLVFISSSSSKSSGLNSLDGSVEGTSPASSSPRVSLLDEGEMLVFIDESDWENGTVLKPSVTDSESRSEVLANSEHTLRFSTDGNVAKEEAAGATVVEILPPEKLMLTMLPTATYQEIVESFSPTHSVDEIETVDHILGRRESEIDSSRNQDLTVSSDEVTATTISISQSADILQDHVNRYFVRSDSNRSSGERSTEEVSFSDHVRPSVIISNSGELDSYRDLFTDISVYTSRSYDNKDIGEISEIKTSSPLSLYLSGWNDKASVTEDGDKAVKEMVPGSEGNGDSAVNVVGETSVLDSLIGARSWAYHIDDNSETSVMALQVNFRNNTTDSTASTDLMEVQSVHCTVDDDSMSLGTFSEDGLTPDPNDVIEPPCNVVLLSHAYCAVSPVPSSQNLDENEVLYLSNNDCARANSGLSDKNADNDLLPTVLPEDRNIGIHKIECCVASGSLTSVEIEDEGLDKPCVDEGPSEGQTVQPEGGSSDGNELALSCLNMDSNGVEEIVDKSNIKEESKFVEVDGIGTDQDDVTSGLVLLPSIEEIHAVCVEDSESVDVVDENVFCAEGESLIVDIDSGPPVYPREERLESDSDSQDTVIECESYKRMRQLALQHKIIEANEELLGDLHVQIQSNTDVGLVNDASEKPEDEEQKAEETVTAEDIVNCVWQEVAADSQGTSASTHCQKIDVLESYSENMAREMLKSVTEDAALHQSLHFVASEESTEEKVDEPVEIGGIVVLSSTFALVEQFADELLVKILHQAISDATASDAKEVLLEDVKAATSTDATNICSPIEIESHQMITKLVEKMVLSAIQDSLAGDVPVNCTEEATTMDVPAELNDKKIASKSTHQEIETMKQKVVLGITSTSVLENEEMETSKPVVDVSSLQELIAKSKAMTAVVEELDVEKPENKGSQLAKYFLEELCGSSTSGAQMDAKDGEALESGVNSLETEPSDENHSESMSDVWESETEKLDESIDDSDTTFSDSASSDEANFDREEELRGFSRTIDFSLHTILEESCEESDGERTKRKPSPPQTLEQSELRNYFDMLVASDPKRRSLAESETSVSSDSYSETSGSLYSDGLDNMDEDVDPAILASSRLEKYFLELREYTRFGDNQGTDDSGSECGSAPARIRKKSLNKPKGTIPRTDSVGSDMSSTSNNGKNGGDPDSGGSSSTLSDVDEDNNEAPFEQNDAFDTIKRKKKSLSVAKSTKSGKGDVGESQKNQNLDKIVELQGLSAKVDVDTGKVLPEKIFSLSSQSDVEVSELKESETLDVTKYITALPDSIVVGSVGIDPVSILDKAKISGLDRKQQSRDSGFIGSSDDLLKDSTEILENEVVTIHDTPVDSTICEAKAPDQSSKEVETLSEQGAVKKKVGREPSNSDDETRYIVGQLMDQITKGLAVRVNGSPLLPRVKPPELEVFEAELTKLMKTVPGIDATVKEIVEELSSTDYYSDSYESSDYNSSEHEGPTRLGLLRRSLRSSLRSNDELRLHWSKDGATGLLVNSEIGEVAEGDTGILAEVDEGLRENANSPFTRETIYIYEKLMVSLGRMAEQASKENSDTEHPGNQSPCSTRSQRSTTLQAVQHIRERLTSLMREVHASSEGSVSARVRRNNSSSSSSSWMGQRMEAAAVLQSAENRETVSRTYAGSLHADITRWLAKQPFHSGDEQSVSSTSSTNYESEDSPTDTEMSVDSDDVGTPATFKGIKDAKNGKAAVSKLERSGSDITIVDDNLSFRSLDTPENFFATHKIGEEANKLKGERLLTDVSFRSLKSLPERGVLDMQYYITQGINDECEVWQSLIIDEEKFKAADMSSLTSGKGTDGEVRPIRARHLLGSLKSSSSDTLQCISEEDLDSKPSSTRTSMLGSTPNICSSQSSLTDFKRGSLEALGSTPERTAQSPSIPGDPDGGGVVKGPSSALRKNIGFVAVDISLSETENEGDDANDRLCQYRSSLHTEVLESGEIALAKDKMDFRSSLHLWMEGDNAKPATRAMSADPLPQDYVFLSPNPLVPKSSSRDLQLRPKNSAVNLSDNQLDRQSRPPPSVKYSTMNKSGPIGFLSVSSSQDSLSSSRPKASTLPRIGSELPANISFLHKNSPDSFLTNNPQPPTAATTTSTAATTAAAPAPQTSKWSRGHHAGTESLVSRREVRSWSAEDSNASTDSKSLTKSSGTLSRGPSAKLSASPISVPQISVSDMNEVGSPVQSHPSGRSSLGSQNNSDKESAPDEDIDRLVALHKTRSGLSSLGNRSDSMTSVYSAAGGGRYGTVEVRGEVLFGLNYNFKMGCLEVSIKKCKDLASVDTKRNRSDPYVKVYLLPDKSKSGKRKTKVRKHTLNPSFDEVLRFYVTISELETRTLWLTVWHSDMFGRNDFLGEVMLPLGYDVFDDDPEPKWYLLQERLGPPEEVITYKGELHLALKFVPPDVTTQKKGKVAKGSLHILVKEARNLMAIRTNGTSDPFCKCYLLPDKSKGGKQKTSVVKKSCNPRWNHTFVYDDITQDDLRDRCLELTVWDYDRLTSNDFLGGVRLSLGAGRYQGKEVDWLDSRGDEIALWQNMLDRPNVWVDGSVLLQPSMEKRPV